MKLKWVHSLALPAFCFCAFCQTDAADQPQFGQAWSRNMISAETGLPSEFNPKTGHNVKWSAQLGTQTYSTPVVAGGRVYIGTNNDEPHDPKHQGDRGVLMCFEEETGRFLWQMAPPGTPAMEPGPMDGDIIWLFDLTTGAGIWSHDAAHSSILIRGPHLYLNTGTSVDNTHVHIRTPDAPRQQPERAVSGIAT